MICLKNTPVNPIFCKNKNKFPKIHETRVFKSYFRVFVFVTPKSLYIFFFAETKQKSWEQREKVGFFRQRKFTLLYRVFFDEKKYFLC